MVKALQFAGKQYCKAGLEPFWTFDNKEIMDHLHVPYAGARFEADDHGDVFLLPPKIACIEQNASTTGRLYWLEARQGPRATSREVPFREQIKPQQSENDIRNMVIAGIFNKASNRGKAHALGKCRPQPRDRRCTRLRFVEIRQQVRGTGDRFFGNALATRRMAEVGIQVDDAR